MKYETIFRRLGEAVQRQPVERPNQLIPYLAARAAALQREALAQSDASARDFQIKVDDQPPLSDRFVRVELCHRVGRGWQTRAVGYLDTYAKYEPAFVSRCRTLGGELKVERSTGSVAFSVFQILDGLEMQWQQEPVPA